MSSLQALIASRPSDFDMRPVYRWSWIFGRWTFRASGRYIRPCPLRLYGT